MVSAVLAKSNFMSLHKTRYPALISAAVTGQIDVQGLATASLLSENSNTSPP